MTGCMDNLDAVSHALLNALPRCAFEHHHDWRAELGPCGGGANSNNEVVSRLGPVPPPAGRARPHDVRSVDQQHIGKIRTIDAPVPCRPPPRPA